MRWLVSSLVVLSSACLGPFPPSGGDGGETSDGGDAGATMADAGTDAGSDGGVVFCERSKAAFTADISLLDDVKSALASASSAEQRARIVDDFFAAVDRGGGTPLRSRSGDRVAFVARGAPSSTWWVAGSFNGWQIGRNALTRVGQSDLYAAELSVPRDAAHAYKLVDGQTWLEDKRARNVVWDGIDRKAVGEFNAVVHPELQDAGKGRLVAWRGFRSSVLNDARDVFIYLPAAYDRAECPTLPSIVYHDGNESLTRSPYTVPADAEFAKDPSLAAVLVFVALPSQNVRIQQYGPGLLADGYLRFLRDELIPALSRSFRLCTSPKDRGISGASMGGLISAYGALTMPDTFGYVGSQSGSYWWDNEMLVAKVRNDPAVPVRFYVDHGCPGDGCDSNRRFVEALKAKGYVHKHLEEAGGQHDWAYWQKRMPEVFRYFREGRMGCE